MYLFVRRAEPRPGAGPKLLEAAARTLPSFSKAAGVPFHLVARVASGRSGGFGVSTLVSSLEELSNAAARLASDESYLQYSEAVGPDVVRAEDLLFQVAVGAPTSDGSAQVMEFSTGIAQPDQISELIMGLAATGEMYVGHGAISYLGGPAAAGPFGQFFLAVGFRSMAHYDEVKAKVNADPKYLEQVKKFVPQSIIGSGELMILQVVATATP